MTNDIITKRRALVVKSRPHHYDDPPDDLPTVASYPYSNEQWLPSFGAPNAEPWGLDKWTDEHMELAR